jgi:YkoY family integral membrane protein
MGKGWNLPRNALAASSAMAASLAFDLETLTLHYHYEPVDIAIFFTLLFLEAALSFDNAAILAALVRRLPVEQRRKALLYGLAGAYTFRIIAIVGVSLIIANPWLKVVGGLYLIYLMGKHLLDPTPHDANVPAVAKSRFLGLTPFWSVVLTVEIADIAFALDQVLAAVGLFADRATGSDKRLLIILASMIAILLLRISAYYVGRLIDWFPRLETLAYIAVGWVGVKLVLVEAVVHMPGHENFDIPKPVSIGVTMLLLVVPVLVKGLFEIVRRRRPTV